MKATTLVKATMSYQLGQVKMTKTIWGVYVTAKKPKEPISCTDIIMAAKALNMMVFFTAEAIVGGKQTPALAVYDQRIQKKKQP